MVTLSNLVTSCGVFVSLACPMLGHVADVIKNKALKIWSLDVINIFPGISMHTALHSLEKKQRAFVNFDNAHYTYYCFLVSLLLFGRCAQSVCLRHFIDLRTSHPWYFKTCAVCMDMVFYSVLLYSILFFSTHYAILSWKVCLGSHAGVIYIHIYIYTKVNLCISMHRV